LEKRIVVVQKLLIGIVFSNEKEVRSKGIITYLPIYYVMFLEYRVPERLLI